MADGSHVILRPLRSDDKRALDLAFHRLSPESNRLRFMSWKKRLTEGDLRYLTETDGHDHVALAAVLCRDLEAIVGVGRFVRDPEHPDTAEVAVVVGDPWQGQGLGRHMGEALADVASWVGVRRFTATMLPENVAAHRLLEHISQRLEVEELAA